MVSLVAEIDEIDEIEQGPAETNCREQYVQYKAVRVVGSSQDGAVVECRSQGSRRTATGLTTAPGGPQ
ncbi:hypothetical protein ACH47C_34690 [Streptomyces rishiriensis]|uniref:hypothetical protein n=1 Tax=Streptomyces rishiriensis TaxID=68264 RepID=UPI00340B70BE